jgi:hypothetical protein
MAHIKLAPCSAVEAQRQHLTSSCLSVLQDCLRLKATATALVLSFVLPVQSRLINPLRQRTCPSSLLIQFIPLAELLVKVREVWWNLGLANPFEGIDKNSSQ